MAHHRVRESSRTIEAEIRALVGEQAELDEANAALAEQVKLFVQSQTPVYTGGAVGSIHIKKLKNTRTRPLPGRVVASDDPMFHMIEYGTAADHQGPEPRRVKMPDGTWVTLDRDTPTRAFAPFGKARAKFGDKIR